MTAAQHVRRAQPEAQLNNSEPQSHTDPRPQTSARTERPLSMASLNGLPQWPPSINSLIGLPQWPPLSCACAQTTLVSAYLPQGRADVLRMLQFLRNLQHRGTEWGAAGALRALCDSRQPRQSL